ncbi:hypothetical protein HY994_05680 [Candidatus Micrarchaeota archaeon]|nr:hypothetical protein [Candidatus Micrarchaeota archaeon]
MAELDALTIGLLGISIVVSLLLLQNTARFQKNLTKESKQLEGILKSLECQALQLKTDVQDLQRVLETKTDHNYLDKRIDGLVHLIKAK